MPKSGAVLPKTGSMLQDLGLPAHSRQEVHSHISDASQPSGSLSPVLTPLSSTYEERGHRRIKTQLKDRQGSADRAQDGGNLQIVEAVSLQACREDSNAAMPKNRPFSYEE